MRRHLVLGFLLLGLCPCVCAADEVDDLLALPLEDLTKLKLTTSTMAEENLRSVPSAMTVFTHEEIQRLGFTELQQLAAQVPGFQVARTDGWGIGYSISNRGRSIPGGLSSILLLIDGQRINNDISGSSQLFNTRVPLDNVERVEFIRGPGSAIYGTNAVSGVINVITRSERVVRAEASSNSGKAGSVQWRADGSDRHFELFAQGETVGGQSSEIFNASTQAMSRTYDPYSARDVSLRANLADFTLTARNARRTADQFYVFGYVDNNANQRIAESSSANLDWHHHLNDATFVQGSAWQKLQKMNFNTNVGVPFSAEVVERELGTQWLLNGSAGERRWLLGWEWRQPKITRNFDNFGTMGPDGGRVINGLFAQYQDAVLRNLNLTAGLRYDHYSDFGGHLSPRLGFVWQATPTDTAKLLYSEAFRAPTRTEQGASTSLFASSTRNLKPETAKTTELIWLHMLGRGLFGATLFNVNGQDSIIETITPASQRTWINSQTNYRGIELEAQYRGQQWQTRLAASRLFSADDPAAARSSNIFSGSLIYAHGAWSAALISTYRSQMVDPNEQNGIASSTEYSRFGGAMLWGAHLRWNVRRGIEFYLHGENIFDRRVLYPADRPTNYAGVPERGRLISTGLRWNFE